MKRVPQLLPVAALLASAVTLTLLMAPKAQATREAATEAGGIAFVDVFTLIDHALATEAFAKARDDFGAQSTQALSGIQQQLQGLQEQIQGLAPEDPNSGTLYNQYQTLQYQYESMSSRINQDYQTLVAQQLSQAYSAIYAGANEVAAAEGYTFVFATRSDGELVQTDTITGITQEILARPLVTPPQGVDLTEAVRVKLGYPDSTATDAATEASTPEKTEGDETESGQESE